MRDGEKEVNVETFIIAQISIGEKSEKCLKAVVKMWIRAK